MITERIFVIPDIHGREDLLEDLLSKLESEEKLDLANDKLIFLGDMIDRGPNSMEVVALVRKMTEENPGRVIALAGNHEWLMVTAVARGKMGDVQLWDLNGGWATEQSYPERNRRELMERDVRWLASLPLYHEEPGFFFSHAPVPTEERRPSHNKGQPFTKEELIWTYFYDEAQGARTVDGVVGVCGHVHRLREQLPGKPYPRLYDHYIFADAGAGCHPKAPLVAIEVKSRKVIYAWPAEAMETQSE